MIVGHKPLTDPLVQNEIFQSLKNIDADSVSLDNWSSLEYFNTFRQWILDSKYNVVHGLDQFQYHAYCAGTYDGIQSFIHRHVTSRRIRFSRAEFVGSKIISNHAGANWCYLEDSPLQKNDAVVLSLPFSGNGSYFSDYDRTMELCSELGIPVLLDLAYFGISSGINYNFSHSCISDLVFSLSKPMSTQLRLGIRMTRKYHDDVVQVLSDNKTFNRIAASVAIQLLNKFSHTWFVERYVPRQHIVCQQFDIHPTPTFTLALGNSQKHEQFWREGYHRICITDELQQTI